MLNIHPWTKDQLHSSEVHSIGGQLLARGHIKMLNIHLGPKISCIVVRCIEEASCWQEDTLKC
jgi:hypothetical protein